MNNLDKIKLESNLNPKEFARLYSNYLKSILDELDYKRIADCIKAGSTPLFGDHHSHKS